MADEKCTGAFHPHHAASCAQQMEFERDFSGVLSNEQKCPYLDTIRGTVYAARYLGKGWHGMTEDTPRQHVEACWTCTPELSPYHLCGTGLR